MSDKNCYPNTNILINKANIKNQKQLDEFESVMFNLSLIKMQEEGFVIKSVYDLFNIHKILFGEVYEWAGNKRTVNIFKEELVLNGLSVNYEDVNYIDKSFSDLNKEYNELNWESNKIIDELIVLSAKLWKIHPFREGNTTSVVVFLYFLAKQNNLELDTKLIGDNAKYFRNALVMASIDEYSESNYLNKILKDALNKNNDNKENKYKTVNNIEMENYKYNYHVIKKS